MTLDDVVAITKPHHDLVVARTLLYIARDALITVAVSDDGPARHTALMALETIDAHPGAAFLQESHAKGAA